MISYSSFIHLVNQIAVLKAVYVTYYYIRNDYHFCSAQLMNQPLNIFLFFFLQRWMESMAYNKSLSFINFRWCVCAHIHIVGWIGKEAFSIYNAIASTPGGPHKLFAWGCTSGDKVTVCQNLSPHILTNMPELSHHHIFNSALLPFCTKGLWLLSPMHQP